MNKAEYVFPQGKSVGDVSVSEGGLTLRDYFAAKAMAMFHDEDGFMEITAKLAYEMADIMIDERENDKSKK